MFLLFLHGFYFLFRLLVVRGVYLYQWLFRAPKDLEAAIIIGDAVLGGIWKSPLKRVVFPVVRSSFPAVELGGLCFLSPITFSSFKDHFETLESWCALGLGGGAFKTLMTQPRQGNRRPRIQEIYVDREPGFINAYGLPGKGVVDMLSHFDQPLFKTNKPIGFSLGGHCVSDYQDVFSQLNHGLSGVSFPYYFEFNLSCPNTDHGRQLADDPQAVEGLLRFVRDKTNVLVSLKLSPDSTNACLQGFVEMMRPYPNMMVNVGNTRLKGCADVGLGSRAISIGKGGVSGAPLFQRTLEMVSLLAPLGVPVMATGGITSFDRVEEVLNKGACLIGVASALVINPYQVAFWVKRLGSAIK